MGSFRRVGEGQFQISGSALAPEENVQKECGREEEEEEEEFCFVLLCKKPFDFSLLKVKLRL